MHTRRPWLTLVLWAATNRSACMRKLQSQKIGPLVVATSSCQSPHHHVPPLRRHSVCCPCVRHRAPPNLVSQVMLVSGLVQNSMHHDVLVAFAAMCLAHISPTQFSLSSATRVVAALSTPCVLALSCPRVVTQAIGRSKLWKEVVGSVQEFKVVCMLCWAWFRCGI